MTGERMDPEKLRSLLPAAPTGLSVVEWLAVATMTAMLLGYLANEFVVRPRQIAKAEDARREVMRAERAEREVATLRFIEALNRQRADFAATMSEFAHANTRSMSEIHARIGDVVRENGATRAAIARLECYRVSPDDDELRPPYQGPERRTQPRSSG